MYWHLKSTKGFVEHNYDTEWCRKSEHTNFKADKQSALESNDATKCSRRYLMVWFADYEIGIRIKRVQINPLPTISLKGYLTLAICTYLTLEINVSMTRQDTRVYRNRAFRYF